jgi:hypothetical protein
MCEISSQPHMRSNRRQDMERFVRNAISIAVAIGTSGLMFAVTLG